MATEPEIQCSWCGGVCDQPRAFFNRVGEAFCSPGHRSSSNLAVARLTGETMAQRVAARSISAADRQILERCRGGCIDYVARDGSFSPKNSHLVERGLLQRVWYDGSYTQVDLTAAGMVAIGMEPRPGGMGDTGRER